MPRAQQPVTFDEVEAATAEDYYPEPNHEYKPEDFGRVHGRVLALDYGLPSADMVRQQRAYYGKLAHITPRRVG